VESRPKFHLFFTDEKPFGHIVLGNSPTGGEYWAGNLLSLAIYNRVLTGQEISQHYQGWKRSEQEELVAFYPFDERSGQRGYDHAGRHHLFIPPGFEVLRETVLVPPWKDFQLNQSYFMDILTNILGFIPFGFFFSAYLCLKKPRSIYCLFLISLLFAGFLSLSIELVQVYLPTRSSQLMDVITNVLGTVIGVALFVKYRKVLEVTGGAKAVQ
jgi:VanZ family protein